MEVIGNIWLVGLLVKVIDPSLPTGSSLNALLETADLATLIHGRG